MIVSIRLARLFFAISLIFWGIQHFMLGKIISGRPPIWPEAFPGQLLFAYFSGLVLIAAGILIIINKKAAFGSMCTGIMIFFLAGMRNILELITKLDYGLTLTNTNKSMMVAFGAVLIASTYESIPPAIHKSFLEKSIEVFSSWTKYFIGAFLLISGIQHFLFSNFVKLLIPAWIIFPIFWVYFSAIALLAGGLGIIIGIHRKLAATLSAYMILSWVFLLHLPRALSINGNANEWTAVFEALATSGILFIIAWGSKKEEAN